MADNLTSAETMDLLAEDCLLANSFLWEGYHDKGLAWYYWAFIPDSDTKEAIKYAIMAIEDLLTMNAYLIDIDPDTYPYCFTLEYLYRFTGTPDWKGICSAWTANDFEGKYWTIACIDRMRQLIWDKPFDIIWAAKPEEQEF